MSGTQPRNLAAAAHKESSAALGMTQNLTYERGLFSQIQPVSGGFQPEVTHPNAMKGQCENHAAPSLFGFDVPRFSRPLFRDEA